MFNWENLRRRTLQVYGIAALLSKGIPHLDSASFLQVSYSLHDESLCIRGNKDKRHQLDPPLEAPAAVTFKNT